MFGRATFPPSAWWRRAGAGVKTMVFPDGKRYEMKAGIPGGRRLN
jgi:hypothetical protein